MKKILLSNIVNGVKRKKSNAKRNSLFFLFSLLDFFINILLRVKIFFIIGKPNIGCVGSVDFFLLFFFYTRKKHVFLKVFLKNCFRKKMYPFFC